MGKEEKSFIVRVTHDDIKKGKRTAAGNPVCRAIRRYGFKGAQFDIWPHGDRFLHIYKGKGWFVIMCPNIAWVWLLKYLSEEEEGAKPFHFYLETKYHARHKTNP